MDKLTWKYKWMIKGIGERDPLPNKYTYEISGDEVAEDIHDSIYESQILTKFMEN